MLQNKYLFLRAAEKLGDPTECMASFDLQIRKLEKWLIKVNAYLEIANKLYEKGFSLSK